MIEYLEFLQSSCDQWTQSLKNSLCMLMALSSSVLDRLDETVLIGLLSISDAISLNHYSRAKILSVITQLDQSPNLRDSLSLNVMSITNRFCLQILFDENNASLELLVFYSDLIGRYLINNPYSQSDGAIESASQDENLANSSTPIDKDPEEAQQLAAMQLLLSRKIEDLIKKRSQSLFNFVQENPCLSFFAQCLENNETISFGPISEKLSQKQNILRCPNRTRKSELLSNVKESYQSSFIFDLFCKFNEHSPPDFSSINLNQSTMTNLMEILIRDSNLSMNLDDLNEKAINDVRQRIKFTVKVIINSQQNSNSQSQCEIFLLSICESLGYVISRYSAFLVIHNIIEDIPEGLHFIDDFLILSSHFERYSGHLFNIAPLILGRNALQPHERNDSASYKEIVSAYSKIILSADESILVDCNQLLQSLSYNYHPTVLYYVFTLRECIIRLLDQNFKEPSSTSNSHVAVFHSYIRILYSQMPESVFLSFITSILHYFVLRGKSRLSHWTFVFINAFRAISLPFEGLINHAFQVIQCILNSNILVNGVGFNGCVDKNKKLSILEREKSLNQQSIECGKLCVNLIVSYFISIASSCSDETYFSTVEEDFIKILCDMHMNNCIALFLYLEFVLDVYEYDYQSDQYMKWDALDKVFRKSVDKMTSANDIQTALKTLIANMPHYRKHRNVFTPPQSVIIDDSGEILVTNIISMRSMSLIASDIHAIFSYRLGAALISDANLYDRITPDTFIRIIMSHASSTHPHVNDRIISTALNIFAFYHNTAASPVDLAIRRRAFSMLTMNTSIESFFRLYMSGTTADTHRIVQTPIETSIRTFDISVKIKPVDSLGLDMFMTTLTRLHASWRQDSKERTYGIYPDMVSWTHTVIHSVASNITASFDGDICIIQDRVSSSLLRVVNVFSDDLVYSVLQSSCSYYLKKLLIQLSLMNINASKNTIEELLPYFLACQTIFNHCLNREMRTSILSGVLDASVMNIMLGCTLRFPIFCKLSAQIFKIIINSIATSFAKNIDLESELFESDRLKILIGLHSIHSVLHAYGVDDILPSQLLSERAIHHLKIDQLPTVHEVWYSYRNNSYTGADTLSKSLEYLIVQENSVASVKIAEPNDQLYAIIQKQVIVVASNQKAIDSKIQTPRVLLSCKTIFDGIGSIIKANEVSSSSTDSDDLIKFLFPEPYMKLFVNIIIVKYTCSLEFSSSIPDLLAALLVLSYEYYKESPEDRVLAYFVKKCMDMIARNIISMPGQRNINPNSIFSFSIKLFDLINTYVFEPASESTSSYLWLLTYLGLIPVVSDIANSNAICNIHNLSFEFIDSAFFRMKKVSDLSLCSLNIITQNGLDNPQSLAETFLNLLCSIINMCLHFIDGVNISGSIKCVYESNYREIVEIWNKVIVTLLQQKISLQKTIIISASSQFFYCDHIVDIVCDLVKSSLVAQTHFSQVSNIDSHLKPVRVNDKKRPLIGKKINAQRTVLNIANDFVEEKLHNSYDITPLPSHTASPSNQVNNQIDLDPIDNHFADGRASTPFDERHEKRHKLDVVSTDASTPTYWSRPVNEIPEVTVNEENKIQAREQNANDIEIDLGNSEDLEESEAWIPSSDLNFDF